MRQLLHHDPSVVVLLLLAHEQRMDIRILHNESDLLRRTGGIHRHIRDPVGIRAKIGIKTLRHVLRIDTDILLYLHAKLRHGGSSQAHLFRKFIPRNFQPSSTGIIAIPQSCTIAVFLCLTRDQFGIMIITTHTCSF